MNISLRSSSPSCSLLLPRPQAPQSPPAGCGDPRGFSPAREKREGERRAEGPRPVRFGPARPGSGAQKGELKGWEGKGGRLVPTLLQLRPVLVAQSGGEARRHRAARGEGRRGGPNSEQKLPSTPTKKNKNNLKKKSPPGRGARGLRGVRAGGGCGGRAAGSGRKEEQRRGERGRQGKEGRGREGAGGAPSPPPPGPRRGRRGPARFKSAAGGVFDVGVPPSDRPAHPARRIPPARLLGPAPPVPLPPPARPGAAHVRSSVAARLRARLRVLPLPGPRGTGRPLRDGSVGQPASRPPPRERRPQEREPSAGVVPRQCMRERAESGGRERGKEDGPESSAKRERGLNASRRVLCRPWEGAGNTRWE